MKKKIGPLPIWAWGAIALTLGYILYRYQSGGEETTEGVEEGLFPTQGIPIEEREGGGGVGGLSALGDALSELESLGFAPPGASDAEERREIRQEKSEEREEGWVERAEIRQEQFEKWVAERANVATGRPPKAHPKKPKPGKPTHVNSPSHKAAAAPKRRIPNGGPGRTPARRPGAVSGGGGSRSAVGGAPHVGKAKAVAKAKHTVKTAVAKAKAVAGGKRRRR